MKPRLTTKQAAEYLAVKGTPYTAGSLEVMRCRGRGPAYHRLQGRIYYAPEDLDRFSEGWRVETVDSLELEAAK